MATPQVRRFLGTMGARLLGSEQSQGPRVQRQASFLSEHTRAARVLPRNQDLSLLDA